MPEDRAETGTAGATGHLAAHGALATPATATTTIRDAQGIMVAGVQGATATPSPGVVRRRSGFPFFGIHHACTNCLADHVFFLPDHRRRSASPGRRSASPATAELPTRGKPDAAGRHSAQSSMSIKVDGKDDEASRARGRGSREDSPHDGRERNEPRKRDHEDGAEPMDENEDVDVEEDGMGDMAAMMGFGGFGSTKGKKVVGNNVGAVRKEKKTEYRQYMNRVGGFNRPLSPSR